MSDRQRSIGYLRWSFLAKVVSSKKTVNYFYKKAISQMFDSVLNTRLWKQKNLLSFKVQPASQTVFLLGKKMSIFYLEMCSKYQSLLKVVLYIWYRVKPLISTTLKLIHSVCEINPFKVILSSYRILEFNLRHQ